AARVREKTRVRDRHALGHTALLSVRHGSGSLPHGGRREGLLPRVVALLDVCLALRARIGPGLVLGTLRLFADAVQGFRPGTETLDRRVEPRSRVVVAAIVLDRGAV